MGSVRESELLIVPFVLQGQHNLVRGKGQLLHHVSQRSEGEEIAETLLTPDIFENFGGNYTSMPSRRL